MKLDQTSATNGSNMHHVDSNETPQLASTFKRHTNYVLIVMQ